MDKILLGSRIKEARIDRGYTLDALASAVQLNKSTLSRYERGEIETPKIPVIQTIANCLSVNPAWLIGKSTDKSYTPPGTRFSLYTPNNLFAPIKNLRLARELSPEEAAYSIGISKEDYLAIENGNNTDCITLARIAEFFCCSTDFALSFDGVINEDAHIEFTRGPLLRLHHAFEKLSEKDQEKVISYANALLLASQAEGAKDNIVLVAARKGGIEEFHYSDQELSEVISKLDQMPDAPDDL